MKELKPQRYTLTKKYFANAIKNELNITLKHSSKLVNDVVDTIIKAILKEHFIEIKDFGCFFIVRTKSRMGRNPKTLEEKEICSSKVVKFRIAKTLKNMINNNIKYMT